jgi:hypothetical protein
MNPSQFNIHAEYRKIADKLKKYGIVYLSANNKKEDVW